MALGEVLVAAAGDQGVCVTLTTSLSYMHKKTVPVHVSCHQASKQPSRCAQVNFFFFSWFGFKAQPDLCVCVIGITLNSENLNDLEMIGIKSHSHGKE